ncbi:MAG: transposase [Candidatus Spechtbacterales bacterium]
MPSKNTVKQYAPNSYYHIYNRGVEKRDIFMDDRDYRVFLSYLKVALSPELEEETKDEALTEIEEARLRRLRLHEDIELLSYCLMPNHFHLFVYQKDHQFAIRDLMRSVMVGYVRYFNKRYKRVGGLFQGRYKASLIDNDAYFSHISRYIHLNPKEWETYPYSSYKYYNGQQQAVWVNPNRILELFDNSREDYNEFLNDYEDYRKGLEELNNYLAAPWQGPTSP